VDPDRPLVWWCGGSAAASTVASTLDR